MKHQTGVKLTAAAAERGMAVMALAALITPGVHAIVKTLGGSLPPGEVAFARFFLQSLLLLPLVLTVERGSIPPPSPSQILRGGVLALATLLFFWGLSYLPLADCIALFYVEPLILVLISALFLGEPVGPRRLVAVAFGFIGVLLVIRPSFAAVGPPALLPLLTAVIYSVYVTIIRHSAGTERPQVMQLWVCVTASVTLASAMALGAIAGVPILTPVWPDSDQLMRLLAMAVIATVSHMMAIHAIRLASPGLLAPFQYVEILGATILGILVFAQWPDVETALGIVIIVGSGLYVFFRERQLARRGTSRT